MVNREYIQREALLLRGKDTCPRHVIDTTAAPAALATARALEALMQLLFIMATPSRVCIATVAYIRCFITRAVVMELLAITSWGYQEDLAIFAMKRRF